jgi:hypothetical protein
MLASLEGLPDPADRLRALARSWDDMRDLVARHGCPVGNLSSEVGRNEDGLKRYAAQSINLIINWAEAQFRELGFPDPRDLAVTLIAGVQGAALLANTLRDPRIMTRQVRHLEDWIDSLT